INGVPCRLLDVQELLSDTGVGRQLHVLVGQGQIDAVLLSKPEDRRAVIEEAAGVLKHRRRKEKALRRLEAMEANLQRLGDLSRELRRQMRPLERQAEAARKHAALVDQLEVLQRFLAGRELSALQARHAQAAMTCGDLEEARDELRARRDAFESAVVTRSEEVTALGRDLDVARDLEERLKRVTDRLGSLAGIATERSRSATLRLEALSSDPRPRLQTEIEEATAVATDAEAQLTVLEPRRHAIDAELAALAERRRALPMPDEPHARARAAHLRAEIAALEGAAERSRADGERQQAQLAQVEEAVAQREGERERLRNEIERLDAASTPLSA